MIQEFEITHDNAFLERFMDKREFLKIPAEVAGKLFDSNDPYGLYGYGRWLYARRKDREALLVARKCFSIAAENGIADAYHMLSRMCKKGHYVSEENDLLVLDNELGDYFAEKARTGGSLLARLEMNADEYFQGTDREKKKAIKDAEEESKKKSASILWTEQLGWFYDAEGRNDDAIGCYERCIQAGWHYPIYDLAQVYYRRGNIAYHDSLMEEGIEKGVPRCMLYGSEDFSIWEELSAKQQEEIHKRLDVNLKRGVEMGCGDCAYIMSYCLCEGALGFERDLPGAVIYARKGMDLGSYLCCGALLSVMEKEDAEELLPKEMIMTEDEKKMTMLIALRYGDNEIVDDVVACRKDYERMGYGEEIEKVWMPVWARPSWWGKDDEEKTVEASKPAKPEPRTAITPQVIIVKPSGIASFVEADVYSMSYSEMAELIGAERVDAIHCSAPLDEITKACGLGKQLAMYVDRDGIHKGLDDNAIGTMLYGNGYEIRGSLIIAMEDIRYDTYSFDTLEDIEAVYNGIKALSGSLLRRES